ncbi:hypothetical protein KBZ18_11145 [Synechococcus sp. Cruz-9H2]|uniref:hypothetical protein n=1 Tax=unclassified Synechococcus TaxID=2626047 RepID=UPI0020CFB33F|nr:MULTISPECIES: hypothetical protein [unclassified Synechococcus]MCP9820045.1 hypothetical protein [Synechococcus sp. Cruz-9H2]MCP9844351.1 hypothetical protein [Synechococcus sp. Edmonson 11F2]MCP9856475.1 hypothetical protein [Synechococcus sp. Cruz-9C9]MCP9863750.1 hypothetical protein [Synechococcus sp. Cruz-7E5]MCP9870955.1 hypothetical protein [Synechococcus sp. Cruz-7B9]
MSTSAGVKLLPSLNWRGMEATDPFPLLIERLSAFIATVNAAPINADQPLTLLRQPSSSTAGVRRGLVLRFGGPIESWIWYWTQSTTAEDSSSVTCHGGHSSLYDNGTGNDGYGAMSTTFGGSSEWQRWDLRGSEVTASVVCDSMQAQAGASALVFAQDTTPGAEWFLFCGDAAAAPMVTHQNPNPWTFLLARDGASGLWTVCLRQLQGMAPNRLGRLGRITSVRPSFQFATVSALHQRLLSRVALLPESRVLTPTSGAPSYSDTVDPNPLCLPAPFWIGPVDTNNTTYPGRNMHVHGRIDLVDGRSLFQLGRGVSPDWWVSFPTAALPAAVAGWTSFTDFAWRARTTALALFEMPVVSGGFADLSDARSQPYAAMAALYQHRVMRKAAVDLLESQGEVIEPGPVEGGPVRPGAGVLWPRRQG